MASDRPPPSPWPQQSLPQPHPHHFPQQHQQTAPPYHYPQQHHHRHPQEHHTLHHHHPQQQQLHQQPAFLYPYPQPLPHDHHHQHHPHQQQQQPAYPPAIPHTHAHHHANYPPQQIQHPVYYLPHHHHHPPFAAPQLPTTAPWPASPAINHHHKHPSHPHHQQPHIQSHPPSHLLQKMPSPADAHDAHWRPPPPQASYASAPLPSSMPAPLSANDVSAPRSLPDLPLPAAPIPFPSATRPVHGSAPSNTAPFPAVSRPSPITSSNTSHQPALHPISYQNNNAMTTTTAPAIAGNTALTTDPAPVHAGKPRTVSGPNSPATSAALSAGVPHSLVMPLLDKHVIDILYPGPNQPSQHKHSKQAPTPTLKKLSSKAAASAATVAGKTEASTPRKSLAASSSSLSTTSATTGNNTTASTLLVKETGSSTHKQPSAKKRKSSEAGPPRKRKAALSASSSLSSHTPLHATVSGTSTPSVPTEPETTAAVVTASASAAQSRSKIDTVSATGTAMVLASSNTSAETPATGTNTPDISLSSSISTTTTSSSSVPVTRTTDKPASTKSRSKSESRQRRRKSMPDHQSVQDTELYCICRKPYDKAKFMIQCDACDEWFHGACIRINQARSEAIDKWYCVECTTTKGLTAIWKSVCVRTGCHMYAVSGSRYCSDACGMRVVRDVVVPHVAIQIPFVVAKRQGLYDALVRASSVDMGDMVSLAKVSASGISPRLMHSVLDSTSLPSVEAGVADAASAADLASKITRAMMSECCRGIARRLDRATDRHRNARLLVRALESRQLRIDDAVDRAYELNTEITLFLEQVVLASDAADASSLDKSGEVNPESTTSNSTSVSTGPNTVLDGTSASASSPTPVMSVSQRDRLGGLGNRICCFDSRISDDWLVDLDPASMAGKTVESVRFERDVDPVKCPPPPVVGVGVSTVIESTNASVGLKSDVVNGSQDDQRAVVGKVDGVREMSVDQVVVDKNAPVASKPVSLSGAAVAEKVATDATTGLANTDDAPPPPTDTTTTATATTIQMPTINLLDQPEKSRFYLPTMCLCRGRCPRHEGWEFSKPREIELELIEAVELVTMLRVRRAELRVRLRCAMKRVGGGIVSVSAVLGDATATMQSVAGIDGVSHADGVASASTDPDVATTASVAPVSLTTEHSLN